MTLASHAADSRAMRDTEIQAQSERSILRKIWDFPLVAMIVAVVLVMALSIGIGALNQEVLQPAMSEAWSTIISTILVVAACIAVYKLVIRKLGQKKHDDLVFAPALRDTMLGFAGGAVLISICVGLAAVAGVYSIIGWESLDSDGVGMVEIFFIGGIYAGFFEELLLRGIIFRWLEELTGSWIALALSSLLFGFLHATNDHATFFSSLAIAIEAGTLLGAAYMLTRSLWLAVGLHAGWNIVQGLWDVPVSGHAVDGLVQAQLEGPDLLAGGGFGLEATIFALVVATGAGIWLLVLAVRKGRIVPPMWSRRGAPITAY